MSGAKKGVAKVIANKESRAIFTHCYGHALKLAVGDTIKQCQVMKSTLEVMTEISKLIKKSPKRDFLFQKLKNHLASVCSAQQGGLYVLHPSRVC